MPDKSERFQVKTFDNDQRLKTVRSENISRQLKDIENYSVQLVRNSAQRKPFLDLLEAAYQEWLKIIDRDEEVLQKRDE